MSIEYNDFGFTAMDADELSSIDTKIVEKTQSAEQVIEQMVKEIHFLLLCKPNECVLISLQEAFFVEKAEENA